MNKVKKNNKFDKEMEAIEKTSQNMLIQYGNSEGLKKRITKFKDSLVIGKLLRDLNSMQNKYNSMVNLNSMQNKCNSRVKCTKTIVKDDDLEKRCAIVKARCSLLSGK